ncbi:hypothetical protein SBD_1648 [Streptomyces bottropensis ATCC 25435]|uniref:Uncharacterized protein n=1 Tax=Streptomyces bottropensis ATCC 25435 TaxID=1054862 RepID=M3DJV0_9ACTN|nr:hypothetical protein SBD_1648 [Streptomyces bottropensis ATCC 25435]
MAAETADSVSDSRCAAPRTDPTSATATKARKREVVVIPIPHHLEHLLRRQ